MGDRSLDDEDFEYGQGGEEEYDDEEGEGYGQQGSQRVQNQPHDEEVALSDTDSIAGGDSPAAAAAKARTYDASLIESQDEEGPNPARSISPETYNKSSYEPSAGKPNAMASIPTPGQAPAARADDDSASALPAGAYNAQEFKHLNVTDDVRELFKYIGRYKAHAIELDTKMKPFIPDYIPSVGSIDEFIKVPRPDGKPDFLGLKVLDEAAARQSDPTVLTLQLRQTSKESTGNKADMIGRIEHHDEAKAKKIASWVSSINDIHKRKPAATVSYTRRMPDIEALMQEWPPEMEAFLKIMRMPSGELDLDLKTWTKMLCSVLDIPVYDNPIESLHVLFSLYLEFKSNPIFKQQLDMDPSMGGGGGSMMGGMGEEGAGGTPKWNGLQSVGNIPPGLMPPSMGGGGGGGGGEGFNVMTFN